MNAIILFLISAMDSDKFREREVAQQILTYIVVFSDRYQPVLDQTTKHKSLEVRSRCGRVFSSYYRSLFKTPDSFPSMWCFSHLRCVQANVDVGQLFFDGRTHRERLASEPCEEAKDVWPDFI